MPAPVKYVARKTVTYVQQDSAYKDRFTLPFTPDPGSTARIQFFDSAGAQIQGDIDGVINGRHIEFRTEYANVAQVANGALFYVYLDTGDAEGEDMAFYGTVFRRQHVFPDNPATTDNTVVKLFEDSFQRPAGALGGRWKTLVGQPVIFDNVDWWGLGPDHANTVGPLFTFFSQYFCFYYTPFNDDSVQLSVSLIKKGTGKTIISLCQNSTATSYLYVGFDGLLNTVELGIGHSPLIGPILLPSLALDPQIEPVSHTVPSDPDGTMGTYKIRYDEVTRTLSLFEADGTSLICDWVDTDAFAPHGAGYRYFGIGGNSGLLDSGVQLAYIRAAGLV